VPQCLRAAYQRSDGFRVQPQITTSATNFRSASLPARRILIFQLAEMSAGYWAEEFHCCRSRASAPRDFPVSALADDESAGSPIGCQHYPRQRSPTEQNGDPTFCDPAALGPLRRPRDGRFPVIKRLSGTATNRRFHSRKGAYLAHALQAWPQVDGGASIDSFRLEINATRTPLPTMCCERNASKPDSTEMTRAQEHLPHGMTRWRLNSPNMRRNISWVPTVSWNPSRRALPVSEMMS